MNKRVEELLAKMTLEEKAGFCTGRDFWHLKGSEEHGIPSIMVADGPHGLRRQGEEADHLGIHSSLPATCFPSGAGLASTWNRELIREVGEALGKEAQALGVSILLGPACNIKRSPLCGRNFEYYSEDPYVTGEIATAFIEGVQSQGVGTSIKHFAANNQEHRRNTVDASVDERTLREIYLAGFEAAIKNARPWTVMCAYNKVNGTYCANHHYLLTEILREEWGFEGFVVSDWGAVNDIVASVQNGLELEMPGSGGMSAEKLAVAVQEGRLSEEKLDEAVGRILRVVLKAAENRREKADFDREAHHALARKAAAESIVLLKNEGGILPLQKEARLAIVGQFAKTPRFQGGGSSHINPTKLESAYDEIRRIVGEENLIYAQGYDLAVDETVEALAAEAREAAAQADAAVLFVGLPDIYESEGYDREHINLPESHQHLIWEVAKANPNCVVVLSNGSPVAMPWISTVKGVLEGHLGGQAGGGAVADILFGLANPSGRLTETFPLKLEDNPSFLNFPGEGNKVEYREGVFVGYRYYDTKKMPVLFPFGYGLSYTEFAYSGLTLSAQSIRDTETVTVSVTVKNVGQRAGQEVVQLYVRDVESSVIRPDKELKGFAKVQLEPGEEKTVSFELDKRAFAYWNTELGDWHVETGEFEVLVGKSSRDIVLSAALPVESTVPLRKIVTRNTRIGDILADPVLGPVFQECAQEYNLGGTLRDSGEDPALSKLMQSLFTNSDLRLLLNFSAGSFTEQQLSELLDRLNAAVK